MAVNKEPRKDGSQTKLKLVRRWSLISFLLSFTLFVFYRPNFGPEGDVLMEVIMGAFTISGFVFGITVWIAVIS